jgi:hypothetical protein
MRTSTAVLLLGLAACSGEEPAGPRTVVRDSAGIAVVDHGVLADRDLPVWSVDPEPALRIGVVEGEEVYQWDELFAGGVLSDGTVVGVDRSAQEIRAYSPVGEHLWSFGRRGEGPGEFRFPWSLHVTPGDTLVISDPGTNRLTLLSPDGEMIGTFAVPTNRGVVLGAGLVGDGTVLVETLIPRRSERHGPAVRETWSVLRATTMDGEEVGRFGEFLLDVEYPEGGTTEGRNSRPIFDEMGVRAGGGGGLWFGDGDAYRVTLFGADSIPLRIVRWVGPDRTIRGEDMDRYRAAFEAEHGQDPEGQSYVQAYFDHQPVADSMATMSRLMTDGSGNLWVQDFRRPDRPGATVGWTVLSPSGDRVLARVTPPAGLALFAAGDGWLLGRGLDEFDVEYLELYGVTGN